MPGSDQETKRIPRSTNPLRKKAYAMSNFFNSIFGGGTPTGFINPNIQPQGIVSDALTGGISLARTAIDPGMGVLSSGAHAGVENATKNTALGLTAGLLAPAAVGRGIGIAPNGEVADSLTSLPIGRPRLMAQGVFKWFQQAVQGSAWASLQRLKYQIGTPAFETLMSHALDAKAIPDHIAYSLLGDDGWQRLAARRSTTETQTPQRNMLYNDDPTRPSGSGIPNAYPGPLIPVGEIENNSPTIDPKDAEAWQRGT